MKKEKGSEEGERDEGGEEIGKGWEWFGKKEKGGDGGEGWKLGKGLEAGKRDGEGGEGMEKVRNFRIRRRIEIKDEK